MMTELEEREYQAASNRLKAWRRSELERKLAAVPKAVVSRNTKMDPGKPDPLGIGSAGTRRKIQRFASPETRR